MEDLPFNLGVAVCRFVFLLGDGHLHIAHGEWRSKLSEGRWDVGFGQM